MIYLNSSLSTALLFFLARCFHFASSQTGSSLITPGFFLIALEQPTLEVMKPLISSNSETAYNSVDDHPNS